MEFVTAKKEIKCFIMTSHLIVYRALLTPLKTDLYVCYLGVRREHQVIDLICKVNTRSRGSDVNLKCAPLY